MNNIEVAYHMFLDGRDVNPKSAYTYIKEIEDMNYGKIASIGGRYYGMDRDNNFDRLKLAYDAIVYGKAPKYNSSKELIDDSYAKDITDEFVIPSIINEGLELRDNDGVITFNFRKDRLREMMTVITNPHEYEKEALIKDMHIKEFKNIKCATMMKVVDTVKCPNAFNELSMNNILGDVLEQNNMSQLRIAETEKYAHVTFFFDGGMEKTYKDENKILIPSPKVATYDLKPEMSAYEVTETLLKELDKDIYDVVILNYANGDMVGHTGVYEAAVKAVECLDECLTKLYDKVKEKDGIMLITADHGNCDTMWDENNVVVTSHTLERVPFIVTKEGLELNEGRLADIAPTMLYLMGIKIPEEMNGNVLIKE
jgi:2,3-bisphosphoglycerate-independent phosphoglycerate mutase